MGTTMAIRAKRNEIASQGFLPGVFLPGQPPNVNLSNERLRIRGTQIHQYHERATVSLFVFYSG